MFRMLEKRSLSYSDGPVPVPTDDAFLVDNVQRIRICEAGMLFILREKNFQVSHRHPRCYALWFCGLGVVVLCRRTMFKLII